MLDACFFVRVWGWVRMGYGVWTCSPRPDVATASYTRITHSFLHLGMYYPVLQLRGDRTPDGSRTDLMGVTIPNSGDKTNKRLLFKDDTLLGNGAPMAEQEHSQLKPRYGTIS
jgi:hypothetical protein